MKTAPFDLEAAVCGEPVVTKSGKKGKYLRRDDDLTALFIYEFDIEGVHRWYNRYGKFAFDDEDENNEALLMLIEDEQPAPCVSPYRHETPTFSEFVGKAIADLSTHAGIRSIGIIDPQPTPTKPTIYLSCPITGQEPAAKARLEAAAALFEAEYNVVNPMALNHDGATTWSDYMRTDIKALVDCDRIYMMNGWQRSRGCCLEYSIAKELGIPMIFEPTPNV